MVVVYRHTTVSHCRCLLFELVDEFLTWSLIHVNGFEFDELAEWENLGPATSMRYASDSKPACVYEPAYVCTTVIRVPS